MNSNDLLDIVGEAKEKHVLDAVKTRTWVKPAKKRLSLNRVVLIAAVIALALLLVGCTVAYVLGLQYKKIGEITGTKYMDEAGQRIDPTEVTRDVISLYGYQGSPNYLAAQEWYEFTSQYDPDYALMTNSNDNGIPDNYYDSYHCYTWDMVKKLEEITQKYHLTPMGVMAVVQSRDTQTFFDALKLNGLCHEDAKAAVTYGSGYFYPEGAFNLTVDFRLTGEDAAWTDPIWSTVHYTRKENFDPKFTTIESDTYEEWNYTTADGTDVLIAMSGQGAFIFAEQEDAYITVSINTDIDWLTPSDSNEHPSKTALEQIADIFDFTIQPQPPEDMEAVRAQLEASAEEWNQQQEQNQQGSGYSQYSGYSDFLLDYNRWVNYNGYYALYDLNGDGVEELLLGNNEDSFTSVMSMVDGEIVDYLFVNGGHLYDNNIIDGYNPTGYSSYAHFFYTLDGHTNMDDELTVLEVVEHDVAEGTWKHGKNLEDGTPISQQEAESILSRYVKIDLKLHPISEYPAGEGKTVDEAARENTQKLSRADILALYAERIKTDQEKSYVPSNYYCLYDINGDGIEELLLASDSDYFSDVYTIYNGKLAAVRYWSHMNLCENQILEFSDVTLLSESHTYYRYTSNGMEFIESVQYSSVTGLWYRDSDMNGSDRQMITEAEYHAIQDSYARVEMEMKPIADFPA